MLKREREAISIDKFEFLGIYRVLYAKSAAQEIAAAFRVLQPTPRINVLKCFLRLLDACRGLIITGRRLAVLNYMSNLDICSNLYSLTLPQHIAVPLDSTNSCITNTKIKAAMMLLTS